MTEIMPEIYEQAMTVIIISLLFQLAGMLLLLLADKTTSKRNRKLVLLNALIIMSIVVSEYCAFAAQANAVVPVRRVLSFYMYIARPVVIVIFMQILEKDRCPWILAAVNALVYFTSFFSDVAYTITPGNEFHRGPLGYTVHVISFILLIWCGWKTIRKYNKDRTAVSIFPVFLIAAVSAATCVDGWVMQRYRISCLSVIAVTASLLYYIWLHLQFEREHGDDLLADERIKIVTSQMQPHFIYNSLSVIEAYLNEPDRAERALERFTLFLRDNIDLLNSTECISAKKEFETVDSFLYLECERFGDKLTVVKELEDEDFSLPAFSVQILVENAVNHGIRKNKGGKGTLSLKSYATEKYHVIEIQDDGPGFDTFVLDEPHTDTAGMSDISKHAHVGIRNVRRRLEYMCGGTLEMFSGSGIEGTKAVIRIPK